jgi:hypothetical protein
MPYSKQMRRWSVCRSNITLVPTRTGEAPLLAAQRRSWAAQRWSG